MRRARTTRFGKMGVVRGDVHQDPGFLNARCGVAAVVRMGRIIVLKASMHGLGGVRLVAVDRPRDGQAFEQCVDEVQSDLYLRLIVGREKFGVDGLAVGHGLLYRCARPRAASSGSVRAATHSSVHAVKVGLAYSDQSRSTAASILSADGSSAAISKRNSSVVRS